MDTTSPPVDIDALADRIAETAALLDVATHQRSNWTIIWWTVGAVTQKKCWKSASAGG